MNLLGEGIELLVTHRTCFSDLGHDGTFVADRLYDVPRTSFALGANEGGALRDPSKGLTEILAPTNEGDFKWVFVDVVLAPKVCKVRVTLEGDDRGRTCSSAGVRTSDSSM